MEQGHSNAKTPGTVLWNDSAPRSHLVDLPQGVVRQNRQHLIHMQTPLRERLCHTATRAGSNVVSFVASNGTAEHQAATPRTRPGRAIVIPKRLNLRTVNIRQKKKVHIIYYCCDIVKGKWKCNGKANSICLCLFYLDRDRPSRKIL